MNDDDFPVLVRRNPDDRRTAACMFSNIQRPCWDNITGGLRSIIPLPMVFGLNSP